MFWVDNVVSELKKRKLSLEWVDDMKTPSGRIHVGALRGVVVHDLVFCESRAALVAVNSVNHSIGMDYCGFLPQHTFIGGPADIIEFNIGNRGTDYGNMNVWALNKDGIKKIGQELETASTR